jgi:hypothetical protein
VVPGGSGIEFNPPIGPDFVWNPANVPANTSMLFYMADAQNRTGGVSGVMVSQATGDSSCINSTSPSSTTGVAVSSTYLSTTTTTSITSPVSRFKRLSAGAISGIVLGGAIGLAGFAALALLFRPWNRKHSASSSVSHRIDIDDGGSSKMPAVPIPLMIPMQRAFAKISSFCLRWNHFLQVLRLGLGAQTRGPSRLG